MTVITSNQTPVDGLADRVHSGIRQLIASGELPEGQQLVIRQLAKRLGVSATPVIEALRRLETDGLVVRYPHRGAWVRGWTEDEVADALLVRALIEEEAARLFVERAALSEKYRLLELAQPPGWSELTPQEWHMPDRAFHDHLVSVGIPMALSVTDRLELYIRTMYYNVAHPGWSVADAVQEHLAIAQAALDNEPERAAQAARYHLNRSQQRLRLARAEGGESSPSTSPGRGHSEGPPESSA